MSSRNSAQPEIALKPPQKLLDAGARFATRIDETVDSGSPFYTVDFAEKQNDDWIIVETGDGQVSGLTEALNPEEFYRKIAVINAR